MSFLWSAWESGMRRRKGRWRNMKRCAALFLAVLLCGVLKGCAPRPEKGQALVEEKGVKVTYTGMEQAEDGDVALHLAVENNSGQPIVVNVQEFSANRCQMAAFFASKVAAGETSHAVLTIPAGSWSGTAWTPWRKRPFSWWCSTGTPWSAS